MPYLLDSNMLVRLANSQDAKFWVATAAVSKLRRRGELLHSTPQIFTEFRSVATRPQAANGLGLPVATVEAMAATFEVDFLLLPDTPDIFPEWKAVVSAAAVVGKQVHDARLAAVCRAHGVPNLLTFNVRHFARFPGVTAVDPATV